MDEVKWAIEKIYVNDDSVSMIILIPNGFLIGQKCLINITTMYYLQLWAIILIEYTMQKIYFRNLLHYILKLFLFFPL